MLFVVRRASKIAMDDVIDDTAVFLRIDILQLFQTLQYIRTRLYRPALHLLSIAFTTFANAEEIEHTCGGCYTGGCQGNRAGFQ